MNTVKLRREAGRIFVCTMMPLLAHSAGVSQSSREHTLRAVSCPDCRIASERVVTLGTSDGPGAIGHVSTVVRLQDGRYVLSYEGNDSEMVVFSSDARQAHGVGRRGRGPGEYEFIRWLRTSDRRLYVFDARLRRVTELSQDKFEVKRTIPVLGFPIGSFAVVGDSLFIVNSLIMNEEHAGNLLHVFDASGRIVASYGADPQGYRFDIPEEYYFRRVVPGGDGDVWVAHRTRYRIEQWSVAGDLLRAWNRELTGFTPHRGERSAPDPSLPPPPRILDMTRDEQGLLWTLVRVASPAWRSAVIERSDRAHPEAGRYEIASYHQAFDSIIEVFDPRNDSVIATARFNEAFLGFAGDRHVVLEHVDQFGVPRLEVRRLLLNSYSHGGS